jgi:hypothetical protein
MGGTQQMTTPALVKSADLKRMAAAVKRDGVRIEIEVNGKIVRVTPDIPDNHRSKPVARHEDFDF